MTPIKLTLRNFTGIRAGLGRDELTLDLAELAGDAVLVAISGPNGTGKTTVMDNLHPFRVLPSRAGGYSPGATSYYDHICGPEALKELIWEHEGITYRSTLVLRDSGKTKKTEAYLHRAVAGGQWQAVTLPDNTSSDGKTDTYDRCVEHILGSPELFFTSAFAAQGRRQLSTYTAGEIKGVLSELLGLDHVLELGMRAGEVVKAARAKLDAVQETLRAVDDIDNGIAAALAERDDRRATLSLNDQAIAAIRASAKQAQQAQAEAQAAQRQHTEIELRRQRLTARLAEINNRLEAELRGFDTQVSTERRRADAANAELGAWATAAKNRRADLEGRLLLQQAVLARRVEIERAADDLPAAVAAVATAEQALASAHADLERFRAMQQAVAVKRADFSALVQDGRRLDEQRQDAERRALLTTQVPCAGTDLQPRCRLLTDALTAQDTAAKLTAEVDAKRIDASRLADEINADLASIATMGEPDANRVAAEAHAQSARADLASLQQTAGLRDSLRVAEETIAAAQADIADIETEQESRAAAVARVVADAADQVAQLTMRRQAAGADADADVQATQAELDQLPPLAASDALAQAEQALTRAEASLADAQRDSDRLREQIGAIDGRVASLREQAARFADARARAAGLEAEVAHWTLLRKALSQDGIVALSIDDAGPTLAALTNDLLLSCYGPRFTVSIRTQAETAKGDMKETFDIAVFDGDADEEKSIRVMSGGERIWLNECLSRAIALYQAQQSGRHYGCLFADESDGALDAERKGQFVAMKRKVIDLGGYRREFFITHSPDLWDLADAVIDLSQFRITP